MRGGVLAKRTLEVRILEEDRIEWRGLTTDERGRKRLAQLGYEVSRYGNRLARTLEKEAGCEVVAGKYLRDAPEEEQCRIPLPSEEEEAFRMDVSMKEYVKKERNGAINRLYALVLFEKRLEGLREQAAERVRNNELAPYVTSIPGIGIAGVLPAYLGDGSRFSATAQAANYAGFTPRVDCSGMLERYRGIARYQYCHPIRGIALEGVWALVKSGKGPLYGKYEE
jgi:hypothetical protein